MHEWVLSLEVYFMIELIMDHHNNHQFLAQALRLLQMQVEWIEFVVSSRTFVQKYKAWQNYPQPQEELQAL